ncbi:mucin-2-like [Elgaria multicarinata webbii]|uniref:mucin-2-like n=1 Tax=Elgaria multicarinata webbii TaxID=159646 RepID=UPI002FCD42E6
MAATRRSLYSLPSVCCLLAGTILSLPGNGQNLSTTPPTALPHSEAGSLGSWTIVPPTVISEDGNITGASQLNASSSSPPETLAPITLSSLKTTTRLQTTGHLAHSSVDFPSLSTPTANFMETNKSSQYDAEPSNTTSWVISSTNGMTTETPHSEETQGPTATHQPKSSIFNTLGPTERRPEPMLVTDHEVVTEESTAESTTALSATVTDGRTLTRNASSTTTQTSGVLSSTLISKGVPPAETEQPVNHVQKIAEADGEDLPSIPEASPVGEDPLVVALIFIFIATAGILALMGFLRYRQRSGRPQFRRLQDLPMDDMMEDTPLSLYSY